MALDIVIKDRESVKEVTAAILKKGNGDLMQGILKDLSLDGRPISTTYDLICQSADLFPDRVALEYIMFTEDYKNPDEIFTYKELLAKIHQTANFFSSLGIGKNPGKDKDVVAFLLQSGPPYVYAPLAVMAAGGISFPINGLLTTREIIELLNASGAKILIGSPIFMGDLDEVGKDVPSLKRVIISIPGEGGEFEEEIEKHDPGKLLDAPSIAMGSIVAFFHTGGTTKKPKLAMHTQSNQLCAIWGVKTFGKVTEKEVILCGLPLFHIFGAYAGTLVPLLSGAKIISYGAMGFREHGAIEVLPDAIEHHQVNWLLGVPKLYTKLLELEEDIGEKMSSLKYAVSSAAPLSVKALKDFEEKSKVPILEGYGATEATLLISLNPLDGEKIPGSVGLPTPGLDVRIAIVDADGKFIRFAEVGEIGEIFVAGLQVFAGYKEEEHNKGIWYFVEGVKYYKTGDVGRIDENGYLYIVDRSKDMIIVSGNNVYPNVEIEEPLRHHPKVLDVAAVGMPDKAAGERAALYVILKPGEKMTEEEMIEYCKENLGGNRVPGRVFFVEEFERTLVEKIKKNLLRHHIIGEVFKGELEAIRDSLGDYHLEVKDDKKLGTLATITITPPSEADKDEIKKLVDKHISPYTLVRYQIEFK
jgi:fatty-acyl-CoA synthase